MFQITWSLTAGCIVEALICYRLVCINSTEFWIPYGYTIFYSDSLVQLIGAGLNVALLWLESAQNKNMRIVKNVERYKTFLIFSIVSLYTLFLLLNFIFLQYWIWQGVLMSYVVMGTIVFGVGACRISKLLSRGVAHAPAVSDKAETQRFDNQRNEISKIVSTSKIVCFVSTFGLGSEMGSLICIQKKAALPKFLLSACLRMSMLCIKVMVIRYLRGSTSFLGLECLNFTATRVQKLRVIQIAPIPRSSNHLHALSICNSRGEPKSAFVCK